MAIILKNGAVFLHIPKTGGTWVTDVLSELDLVGLPFKHKHLTLQRLPPDRRQFTLGVALRVLKRPNRARRKALSHLLARRPFIFTFTRHPLAWYESWYAYMSLEKNNWRDWGIKGRKDMKNWHPCADLNGLGGGDFENFMRNVIASRPGFVSWLYRQYTAGEVVDFVGKQERLADDLLEALKRMGERPDERLVRRLAKKPQNVSRGRTEIKWDPALEEQVRDLEREALARFRYE